MTSTNQAATPAMQTTIANAVQPSFVTRLGQLYRRDTINISLDKAIASSILDPDDY